ncbi:delta-lactam-biosynthetic de-N-acetylase [Thalassobacillus sp. CUG 92003]|uniref:delta-lactam-biosynthetic de-N-acetylase n=1 Tax=Thalassobacillus sp. CUG 92003 TaxID=2736641 RepID=UPI0015E7BC4C|nr:delta-lactam-biosynthetic de-N-acetylase [Thalassobacillus sp. CUG 92003]
MKIKWCLIITLMLTVVLPHSVSAAGWGYKKNKGELPEVGKYQDMIEKHDGIFADLSGDKVVYLTFDNGYEAGYTPMVLDTLKKKNVPATFFVTGHYLNSAPELVQRMVKEGHIIGNHSWNHPDLTTLSQAKLEEELKRVDEKVAELTAQDSITFLRPPKGTFDDQSLQMTRELGYIHAFWSIAFVDWETDKQKGWEYAYNSVVDQLHPGAVILLHTVAKDNAEALEHLIDELHKQGYTFKSLDHLMMKKLLPFPVYGM